MGKNPAKIRPFIKIATTIGMYILGINEALGASAALLKDGEIIAASLEERFTRIKNASGFPKNAIRFCCNWANIKTSEIDLVVLSYEDPYPHFTTKRATEIPNTTPLVLNKLRDLAPWLEYRFPFLNQFTDWGRSMYYSYYYQKNQQVQVAEIVLCLKIPSAKIIRVNHHLCHAYSAFYTFGQKVQPTLVLTCDGAGDRVCATVSTFIDGKYNLLSQTPHVHSLGLLYASITSYLGFKAHEDEYKVMGLAPYAKNAKWQKIYELFKSLIWVEGLEFRSKIPARHFDFFLDQYLRRIRFDFIAGAAQTFLEDKLAEWVENAITQTGIKNVAFAGGVFLNVKANLEILKRTKIRQAYFLPSPGDDSNTFGACFFGYKFMRKSAKVANNIHPLTHMYLGPDFPDINMQHLLKLTKGVQVTRPKNITSTVAKLLARGEIVARFSGRMEFGARALGNRSILADPRKREAVEKINRMIKMRDFWMPFAPTILAESANSYIVNPKKLLAPYMIVAFKTTEAGKKDLAATVHPYDKTARPQILTRSINPEYYDLILEFAKLTGVAALLNTSFNIHGEPIVCSPQDALSTFVRSGLKYLQLNNILLTKK